MSPTGDQLERIKQNTGEDGHGHGHGHGNFDLERVKAAFANQEGCKIYGFMLVNKVPGNFHISSHAFGNLLP